MVKGQEVIFYCNDAGEEQPKEKATRYILTEYDARGRQIREVWGTMDPKKDSKTK